MGVSKTKNNTLNEKNRIVWIDVLRGILIISVVAGHFYNRTDFQMIVYWFHMPCFVMLSGFLSKNETITFSFVKRKAERLLIPAAFYSVLTMKFVYGGWRLSIYNVLLGCSRNVKGVLWFIPALFITEILWAIIVKILKPKYHLVVAFGLIIVSTLYSKYLFTGGYFPYSADVIPIMIGYFGIGNLLGKYEFTFEKQGALTVSCIIVCVPIIGHYTMRFEYAFDMKQALYANLWMNIFFPIAAFCLLRYCAVLICKIDYLITIFKIIGKCSLQIMYLHMPINTFLLNRIAYGGMIYIFMGIMIPILFVIIFSRQNKFRLLLGMPNLGIL